MNRRTLHDSLDIDILDLSSTRPGQLGPSASVRRWGMLDQKGGVHTEGNGQLLEHVEIDRFGAAVLKAIDGRASHPSGIGELGLGPPFGNPQFAQAQPDRSHAFQCTRNDAQVKQYALAWHLTLCNLSRTFTEG